jgi:hypothetical protein
VTNVESAFPPSDQKVVTHCPIERSYQSGAVVMVVSKLREKSTTSAPAGDGSGVEALDVCAVCDPDVEAASPRIPIDTAAITRMPIKE